MPHEQLLKNLYGNFIAGWYRFFRCEVRTILLEPVSGHGYWDGKQPFGELSLQNNLTSRVAVLTRATIRLKKINRFWKHVDGVAKKLKTTEGLLTSVSIGELPFIKQATFSIWNAMEDMQAFAYATRQHTEIIHKTREERWYSEELFVRFKIIAEYGKINA